jgi:hypothetical protein
MADAESVESNAIVATTIMAATESSLSGQFGES